MLTKSNPLLALVLGALTIAVYMASLQWVFPGEFHPFTPHHPDLYQFVGLYARPFLDVAAFPRPVIFLLYRAAGCLGVQYALLMPIGAVLIAAFLAPFAVSRLNGARPSPIAFLAYLILLFTHPQFYFHHRHDGTAGFATFLVFAAMMATAAWLRNPTWQRYALVMCPVALMALSKETCAISLPVLLATQCLLDWAGIGWKRALALVGGACTIEATGMVYSGLRFLHYTGPIAPGSTYAADLHPASILLVFLHYCADAFSPATVGGTALALIAVFLFNGRKWSAMAMPLACIVAGFLALIPNSILPRHYESQYAWNALPFVFAVILFIPSGRKWSGGVQTAVLALSVLSIVGYQPAYASPMLQWLLNQERANVRIVNSLPEIRRQTAGARRVLVAGLAASYHPWDQPDFLRGYFGQDISWTFVISRDLNESTRPNVLMRRPGSVRLTDYQAAVRFEGDGRLRDILAGPALQKTIADSPEAVLVPELAASAETLKSKPDDFMALLRGGSEALKWGLPHRALAMLEHASRIDPGNPYPWFFMGQAESALRDYAAARAHYQRAIAAAGSDANPAFNRALSELPPR